jgi:ABC-type nitrate/sulfonate/bicarbonate transport system substrate-binding protein
MWWLTSGILLVSVLAACAPSGTAPAAPPQAPPAASPPSAVPAAPAAPAAAPAKPELEPISLEVGLPATTAFTWPFLVIRDGPIGAQERMSLELPILDTDQRVTQATLSGSVDFGEAAFDTVVRAVEQGGDVVTIGGNINRPPYALAVRQGIDSIADLRGKRFAVTDLRGGSTLVLKQLLDANGLCDGDYELLPLGGTPNRYGALVNGAADAAMLAQPADFKAQDEGYRLLTYTTESDFQFTTYVARRSVVEREPEKVRRFLRALVAAHRWLHDPANRDQAVELGMAFYRSSRVDMERTWDVYFKENPNRVMPRDAEVNRPGADAVVRALADQGEVRDPGRGAAPYIDERYLQDVLRGN